MDNSGVQFVGFSNSHWFNGLLAKKLACTKLYIAVPLERFKESLENSNPMENRGEIMKDKVEKAHAHGIWNWSLLLGKISKNLNTVLNSMTGTKFLSKRQLPISQKPSTGSVGMFMKHKTKETDKRKI
uniref:Uncharacterized protein n=1 Tax=Romanomermis culicivorax TaxID=13658 RepID=A0A915ID10_ROMCU